MLYAIDLFCGAGGMSEGLIQAGFHILFSSDISADVQKTYVNRHTQLGLVQGYNTYFHCGDIRNLDGSFIWGCINNLHIFAQEGLPAPQAIDAIFGGPPCQGFSRAGKREADDPRNLLFREYLRVIQQLQPRYVVMENVEGFNDTRFRGFRGVNGDLYVDGTPVPEILLNEFNMLGYNVLAPQLLDASDYGVPQRRKRVVFIAYLQGMPTPQYPQPTIEDDERLTVLDAIGDLILNAETRNEVNHELSQYQVESRNGRTPRLNGHPIPSNGIIYNNELSKHQKAIIERFSLFREGEDGNDLKRRILLNGIDLSDTPSLLKHCAKSMNMSDAELNRAFIDKNPTDAMLMKLLTKKTIRTKLNRDKPSLTIVTLPDDYISPFEDRIFSVREMARLQSFDDSFVFLSKRTTGGKRRRVEVPQYTQVGNAVPPLMSRAVALEIRKALAVIR